MFRGRLVASILLFACASMSAAQSRPDFSGRWTLDPSKSTMSGGGRDGARGGGGGRGGGIGLGPPAEQLTITQTTATLEMALVIGGQSRTVTYVLDGSRRQNMLPVGQGGTVEATYQSRWDGAKLVTTIARTITARGGTTIARYREVVSIDKDGRLVIETTASGPRSGGRKSVYGRTQPTTELIGRPTAH
jgi:hypothetical protein